MKKRAFTLIELSIVLVIIGLIVGGVLVGQDLIETAKKRALISQIESIDAALNTFRLKYNGLPGDIDNATAIWGADASCPNTPTNNTPKEATCDGNGDKKIGDTISNSTVASRRYEWQRAWQQLANAGLIEGSFTGVEGAKGDYDMVGGVNAPPVAGYGNAGTMMLFYYFNTVGASSIYPHPTGHWLWIGESITQVNGQPIMPLFPVTTVYDIDTKVDDGLPGTERIQSFKSYTPNCYSAGSPDTYNLSYDGVACAMSYQIRN